MVFAMPNPNALSHKANASFANNQNRFAVEALPDFLEKFAKGHFASACAFPNRERNTHVIAARLTTAPNGGDDIFMGAEDVNFMLEILRRPEYKSENEAGQLVTNYPKLVDALVEAKTNIALYSAGEMQAYLSRRFSGSVTGKNALGTPANMRGASCLVRVK